LEKRGYKEQALVVSNDPDHRFELALTLHKLTVARDIAIQLDNIHKWKQLAEAAMKKSLFDLAEECLANANDFSGQLLLYSSAGKADKMAALADAAVAAGKNNVAFVAFLLLGRTDDCINLLKNSNRLPEATLFARTYAPSRVSEITKLWKESLQTSNPKISQSLADPAEYANLFPGFAQQLEAEAALKATPLPHAADYPNISVQRKIPLMQRFQSGALGNGRAHVEDEKSVSEEEESPRSKAIPASVTTPASVAASVAAPVSPAPASPTKSITTSAPPASTAVPPPAKPLQQQAAAVAAPATVSATKKSAEADDDDFNLDDVDPNTNADDIDEEDLLKD